MPEQLLRTKLFVPPRRPNLIPRPRLIDRLNRGLSLGHKLTLISAPAGFGKTTLATEWLSSSPRTNVWLSLDVGDSDPARFFSYFAAALRQIAAGFGQGLEAALQTLQQKVSESLLAALVNEMSLIADEVIFVLDDYHLIDHELAAMIMNFIVEHLPPQMHLVIVTREDPQLPLARMRAGGELTELRAADLRFKQAEAATFLNKAAALDLGPDEIAALDRRTEGWIAGLQLAALSMQGQQDTAQFIQSFTGSHRFVLDYLAEEVLQKQPAAIQKFLLYTAVLDRLSGPLCDAVLQDRALSGQENLEYLEQRNLFIIPLDNERIWYRYHHLFSDLLRRRLQEYAAARSQDDVVAGCHIRASSWYEENNLYVEAFQHAAAADDIDRAARLIEGQGLPLSFQGATVPVLRWLASLPEAELEARPSLLVTYAMSDLSTGQLSRVEELLQKAERGLEGQEPNDETRDLIGRIADIRGTVAVGLRQVDVLIEQSQRALEYLQPDNETYRTSTTWKLGVAYEWQGKRLAAEKAYNDAIASSKASGNIYTHVLALTGLGNIYLAENRLHQAAETYEQVIRMVGDLPIPVGCHVHLCLGRIHYEWNELEAAQKHGQRSAELARQFKDYSFIFVDSQIFLARLKLAQRDLSGAWLILSEAEQLVSQQDYDYLMPRIWAVQVLILLRQSNLPEAAVLAEKCQLPLTRARVYLAGGDGQKAAKVLAPVLLEAEAQQWPDEQLKIMALESLIAESLDDKDAAVRFLHQALALGEPGGFIRMFVDEGPPMARLLKSIQARGSVAAYVQRLLGAFADPVEPGNGSKQHPAQPQMSQLIWYEPLSSRELEVLQLIAQGLTNREVAARLYLALNTVKAHTRSIYGKLGVNNRMQAVAKARDLGMLDSP